MLSALVPLTVLALGLAACGTKQAHPHVADNEGFYVDAGGITYQVQLSRELNPANIEDAAYLKGLTPADSHLAPGQEWFAVFMQVYNHSSTPLPAATNLTISDTQNNIYVPIVPDATNEFAYRGGLVPAKSQLPLPETVAVSGATQGALLLYKIPIVSLDNRPLELKIIDPNHPTQTASAELDV